MVFFSDLETILDIVHDLESTDKAGLASKLSGRSQQIAQCKTMLDTAFQSFQVGGTFVSFVVLNRCLLCL